MGTPDRQRHGHRDSMIESAQWADSMKIYKNPRGLSNKQPISSQENPALSFKFLRLYLF